MTDDAIRVEIISYKPVVVSVFIFKHGEQISRMEAKGVKKLSTHIIAHICIYAFM
jgi:hypothetical protein